MSKNTYNPYRRKVTLILNNWTRSTNGSLIPDLKHLILLFLTDFGIFYDLFKTRGLFNEENTSDSSEDYRESALIIDNGSYMIKAGYSGEDAPRTVFPSVVGRPKNVKLHMKKEFVGDEAWSQGGFLKLSYPIKNGIITNFDDMEKLWNSIFKNELRIASEEYNVLLTEKALNSVKNKEKMSEIMFEKFNVCGMYIAPDPILSLFATGRTTGTVVNIGEEISEIVPISEGYCIPNCIKSLNLGGKHITNYLIELLAKRGYKLNGFVEKDIVRDIKEVLCYISDDLEYELMPTKSSSEIWQNYELPDGQVITIGKERPTAPEIMFNPKMINLNEKGIDSLINDCIISCPENIRKELWNNIVLSGGSTMFHGIGERFKGSLKSQTNNSVKVIAAPERKYIVWIGGSIVASVSRFNEYWISANEYKLYGKILYINMYQIH